MGFEPTTSAVTGRRSNQLSHRAYFFCVSGSNFSFVQAILCTEFASRPGREMDLQGLEPGTDRL